MSPPLTMQVRFVVPLLSMVCIVLTFVLTFVRCGGSPFTFYKMDVNGDGAIVSIARVSMARVSMATVSIAIDGCQRRRRVPRRDPNPDP